MGMHRICDMVKANESFYTWSHLQLKGLQSKNFLLWPGLIDAIPVSWKKELKSNTLSHTPPFDPALEFALVLNSAKVSESEINTKNCMKHRCLICVKSLQHNLDLNASRF